ncbi:MAG: EamA family transporter [Candidatus Limnocylindrales bacterium]
MEPLGLLYGLASAVSWGTADFAGGLASRRIATVLAVLGGQSVGFVIAIAFVIVSREPVPPVEALAWGALAGTSGTIGLAGFYRVLAAGQMSLAAPLVAVIGAGVPALVGLLLGDPLKALQLLGIVCGLCAIGIVSWTGGAPLTDPEALVRGEASPAPAVTNAWPLILLAGLGFAGFFLAIHQATELSGQTWWPLLAARAATVGVAVVMVAALRPARRGVAAAWPLFLLIGCGDFGGNAFFVLASQQGPLSVAVILSSLYPVTTVLLAAWLLRERLQRWQLAGVALALVGVLLIAV